jgi:hypothetical protein
MENNQNPQIGSWERTERLGPQRRLRECGVQAPEWYCTVPFPSCGCIPHAQMPTCRASIAHGEMVGWLDIRWLPVSACCYESEGPVCACVGCDLARLITCGCSLEASSPDRGHSIRCGHCKYARAAALCSVWGLVP